MLNLIRPALVFQNFRPGNICAAFLLCQVSVSLGEVLHLRRKSVENDREGSREQKFQATVKWNA